MIYIYLFTGHSVYYWPNASYQRHHFIVYLFNLIFDNTFNICHQLILNVVQF